MTKSPRRLKQQVQDTVGEQVRDLPLHAVRLAMFGVGRALLLGDRVTRDFKEITEGGGVKPVLGRLRDDVQGTAEKVVGRVLERVHGEEPEPAPEPKSAPEPGPTQPKHAGRPTGEEISIGKPGGGTRHTPKHARPGPPPKPAKPGALGRRHAESTGKTGDRPKDEARSNGKAEFEPRPESKPAAPAEAERLAESLPVPDYDNATLPQLRARLRGLSVDQVKLLREYERKHAAREDVIRMYERRIAKLNGTS
ncbi:hypothetical protein BZB76_4808 [Actinomadura pelletieri DSM 43383]|uniref:DUF8129 domain-containing protein n=1 Tax=Actinomadura pelletieri DSM 43383 TaxID=1120940 RepID=A0A495QIM6_9ACTN|nr:hypothetical protein [Actinomadura pelletieri]RKS71997.1 hypothetical protein BZB76_4808 [Actinomadura pelletieri DSM 43383]